MPHWVLAELNTLSYNFFWSGKKDLVACAVVCQSTDCGGFSVVNITYKTSALLVQWVRRLICSPNTWVSLLTFWYFNRFSASLLEVFSLCFLFDPSCCLLFIIRCCLLGRCLVATFPTLQIRFRLAVTLASVIQWNPCHVSLYTSIFYLSKRVRLTAWLNFSQSMVPCIALPLGSNSF